MFHRRSVKWNLIKWVWYGNAYWAEDCSSGMMSTYLSLLDPVVRERYTKRLDILGLKEEDDPYAEHSSHKFKDDFGFMSAN